MRAARKRESHSRVSPHFRPTIPTWPMADDVATGRYRVATRALRCLHTSLRSKIVANKTRSSKDNGNKTNKAPLALRANNIQGTCLQ
eukprot:386802-Prymnesium_polylepis.1